MSEITVAGAVHVLGDTDTIARGDLLAEKAAGQGVRIAQTFAFDPGAAAAEDDLTEVEAVVAALSRAIATRTSIWCPFPHQDLCREQHFRRLSLVLQRHGLNLLFGQDLTPAPTAGGYHEVDAALRKEVRAVDQLDHAALAAVGLRTLGAEIEAALADGTAAAGRFDDEIFFSTAEAAGLLGKSASWLSRLVRERVFFYPDGSPITVLRVAGRLRFTPSVLRGIAQCTHRRGTLSRQEFGAVLTRLANAA